MAIGTTSNYVDIIDSRPLEVFQFTYAQNPLSYTEIFDTESITRAFKDNIRFSGLGRFVTKQEGAEVTYDTPVQGRRMRTTMATYALGTQFTMEALMDAQHDVLEQQVEALTRSQLDHEERLAWGAVSDSFDGNSTGVGIDNVSVINTAHPLLKPPTSSTTTRTNQLSPGAPLSVEAIEAMLTIADTQISEEGHKIGASISGRMKKLVIPSSLRWVAWTILQPGGRPGGDLNDRNPVGALGLQMVHSPYLDDNDTNDFWLMADKGSNGWKFYSRMEPTPSRSIDSETGNRKWQLMYRANVANVKPMGNVGSTI